MPKRNILTFIILFIAIFCAVIFSYAEVVDKILVIVNEEVITQGELDMILYPAYRKYRELYANEEGLAEKIGEIRRNALKKLISDKLLLAEARKREIEATRREVQARIDIMKKGFVSEEEFDMAMEQEGMDLSDIEKKYEEKIMIDKLIDIEIRRKAVVSPSEIFSYYEKHKKDFAEPGKAKVRSILIKITEDRPKDEALKFAEEILRRLDAGSDFRLLAKKYSDGPFAIAEGDMGWIQKGEMMESIDNHIFSMRENSVSGILETKLGFHIFLLEEKVLPRIKEYSEVKYSIEQILFRENVQERLEKWVEQLKKDAYIAFK